VEEGAPLRSNTAKSSYRSRSSDGEKNDLAAPTGLAIRLSPRSKGGTVVDDKRERVFVFRDGRESAATGQADILQKVYKPPFHVAASWPTNWVGIIMSIVVPPRMRGRLVAMEIARSTARA
jgi:hypothetical protein